MSLCPEAEYRASLSDGEFWEHVFHGDDGPDDRDYDPEMDFNIPPPNEIDISEQCPICGSTGACKYDEEGLPMIHAVGVRD